MKGFVVSAVALFVSLSVAQNLSAIEDLPACGVRALNVQCDELELTTV